MRTQLSLADAAKTLLLASRTGHLAVLEADGDVPYVAAVEFMLDDAALPIFFFSDLAVHGKAVIKNTAVALHVSSACDDEVLIYPRASMMGVLQTVERSPSLQARYVQAFAHAQTYIDFNDFQFYRLQIARIRYIAGFARIAQAQGDLLGAIASSAIAHMNADHAENLTDIAKYHARLDWAETMKMTQLDRFGFDLLVRADQRSETTRIVFPQPLTAASQLRDAMTAFAQQAKNAPEQP